MFAIGVLNCLDSKDLGHLHNHSDSDHIDLLPFLSWGFLVYTLLLFGSYAVSVINQIAAHLGISVLWVPKEIQNAEKDK